MCCHRSLGQSAEALAVYQRCRQTLGAVLGVAPSRELEALGRALGAVPPSRPDDARPGRT